MIYSNLQNLFIDLAKYNEQHIEFLGNLQIPMTNIYYFTIFDKTNSEINKFISYLTNTKSQVEVDTKSDTDDDSKHDVCCLNPFDDYKNNMNLDEDQICFIDIVKSNLKTIDRKITEMLETASESSAQIALVLDIGFLFDLINLFKETKTEIHLYDFILHKLKNKIDKLFILDSKSILKINDGNSSVFDELKMYLLVVQNPEFDIIYNPEITIYKSDSSLYWKILRDDQKIVYDFKHADVLDDDYDENILTTKT
jgi:hypothetical protein